MHGRYIWTLALSKSSVLDEMKKALGEMVEVRALINTVLWALGSMLLIMAINPVAPALVAVVGVTRSSSTHWTMQRRPVAASWTAVRG